MINAGANNNAARSTPLRLPAVSEASRTSRATCGKYRPAPLLITRKSVPGTNRRHSGKAMEISRRTLNPSAFGVDFCAVCVVLIVVYAHARRDSGCLLRWSERRQIGRAHV